MTTRIVTHVVFVRTQIYIKILYILRELKKIEYFKILLIIFKFLYMELFYYFYMICLLTIYDMLHFAN